MAEKVCFRSSCGRTGQTLKEDIFNPISSEACDVDGASRGGVAPPRGRKFLLLLAGG